MKRVVIFASGNGSTFDYLAEHSAGVFSIVGLFYNKPEAGVVSLARQRDIPVFFVDQAQHWQLDLASLAPDLIVLAGYLKLIPEAITKTYQIINTHPALLPAYGGQGFYGARVHKAVLAAGETISGVSVHRVDEAYDRGEILAQESVEIKPNDTPHSLALRVQAVEKPLLLRVIKQLLEEV